MITRALIIRGFFSLLFAASIAPTFANEKIPKTETKNEKKTYVVYLGGHSHNQPGAGGVQTASEDGQEDAFVRDMRIKRAHQALLLGAGSSAAATSSGISTASVGGTLGASAMAHKGANDPILYSYTKHINGFAAKLDDAQVEALKKNPDVISVFESQQNKLMTTRSWDFLGLRKNGQVPPNSAWEKAKYGENIIIGNIDSGVWPDSKSFSDEGYGPIPGKWKGICQNTQDTAFHCNKKLIGARYFNKAYGLDHALNSTYDNTPRDHKGHGTHTLSTAGGNFVGDVSMFGHGMGTISGGSPKARVATYKVCWPPVTRAGGCLDADILAAFDAAIEDGVDVISASIGGNYRPFFTDPIAIGSFHAAAVGISVVCAGGNAGPAPGEMSNVAPWILTVGAASIDRAFRSDLVIDNNLRITGQSLSKDALPNNKAFPIVTAQSVKLEEAADEDAKNCYPETLDKAQATGKILICMREGLSMRVMKGEVAALNGAVGMVLANSEMDGNEYIADPHVLPATQINRTAGDSLISALKETTTAYITPPVDELGTKPAPTVASFSGRGPNPATIEILKPDVVAPGVDIISAYTEAKSPNKENSDARTFQYQALSGTSMACPHVAGLVGLVKAVHPDWHPSAIKSALMTTANTIDNTGNIMGDAYYVNGSTPFTRGSGLVDPNRALDPGLVYELTGDDYLGYLCSLGYSPEQITSFSGGKFTCPASFSLVNFNYPAIVVPNLSGPVKVTRTVKNVGGPGTYNAITGNPPGLSYVVEPKSLTFGAAGETKPYTVTIALAAGGTPTNATGSGTLTWSDGTRNVTITIAATFK